jgi:hypothetical protein
MGVGCVESLGCEHRQVRARAALAPGDHLLAPVAERASPFDLELGPSGSRVAAVYSRCTDTLTLEGCNIVELSLGVAGASERTLAPPGGGSVHEPAIWKRRLVFLRRAAAYRSR